MFRIINLISI
jgi:hypothetical protein